MSSDLFRNLFISGETKTEYHDLFQKKFSYVQGELNTLTAEFNKVMRKMSEVFQLADRINNEGVHVICNDCGRKKKLKSPSKDSFFLCSHTSESQGIRNARPQSSGYAAGRGRTPEQQETLIQSLLAENDRLVSENKTLKSKLGMLEKENGDNNFRISVLENEIEVEKRRNGEFTAETANHRSTIEKFKRRIYEMETECKQGRSIIVTLQEEVMQLQSDHSQQKDRAKHPLVLNIHTNLKTTLALPAQEHIEQCLKEKFEASGMGLQTRPYDPADPKPGPTLVICMNVSGLGNDVKEAVKDTTGNKDVVVVVLHHKEVHALPNQSSDRILIREGYRRLGAIVDAAFLTGRGMYECDMNRQAIEKIFAFLKTFLTQKE